MIIALIILASIASCFLYTRIPLAALGKLLMKSYAQVLSIIKGTEPESQKQQHILAQSLLQFKLIGKILFRAIILLSPFLITYLCYNFIQKTDLLSFFTLRNTIISGVTVLVWVLVEKNAH
ncbi:MAG: hypothetical protein JST58_19320 [Bacteroidetes bacterium]|nr:hypothetical protein [Bacteroidota bacterium]